MSIEGDEGLRCSLVADAVLLSSLHRLLTAPAGHRPRGCRNRQHRQQHRWSGQSPRPSAIASSSLSPARSRHPLSAPIRLLRYHTDHILRARRLIVPAGKATAAPPIGPALGARGVKSIDFVKEFNGQSLPFVRAVDARTDVQPNPTVQTANLTPGTPTPVSITIQPDRTFTFVTKTPPTMWLVKQAAGIETASGEAGRPNVAPAGTLSVKHVYEIARIKQRDQHLRHVPLEAIAKSVVGQCKSAGVAVVP